VASTAELAGEEAPALVTIGRDGAVFYWMYDAPAAGTSIKAQSQGYLQVPGKHRKRQAPDTDPVQPAVGAEARTAAAPATDDDVDSNASDSNSSSSDASEQAAVRSDEDEQTGDVSREEMQAGTSGRQQASEQQHQTTSYAGKGGFC